MVAQVCLNGRGNFGSCSGLRVAWFEGNGDGTFATTYGELASANGSPAARVTVGYVTGDGAADVLVPDNFFSAATGSMLRLRVFPGGPSGPGAAIEFPLGAFNGNFGTNVTVADVTGDGIGDAVIRAYDVAGALWRTRTLVGDVALAATSVPVDGAQNDGLGSWAAIAGDLNGDGAADLVASSASGAYSLLSNGDGTFAGPVAVAGAAASVRLADLDQDSTLDLVVNGGGTLLFRHGIGDGAFGDAEYLATAQGLAVGDFNGDGNTDIFFRASFSQSQSTVLLVSSSPAGDGDGIDTAIDGAWDGASFTDEHTIPSARFTDQHLGGTTYGGIVDAAGLTVTVQDAANPDGVSVSVGPGSGDATLSTCGIGTTYVAAGSSVVVTCGSIQVQVVTGAARVVVGGGTVVVDVPAGVTAKVADLGGGNFSVENLGGGDVTVTNNGVASLVPAGETGSIDTTPPTIAPLVTGSLGTNGWYRSDASVSWSVDDPDSAVVTTGCGTSTVSTDTLGVSFTSQATSGGGSASSTVVVTRDATKPTVVFGSHPASYTVDQDIAITCTATDVTSGLSTSTCAKVNAPVYTFAVGAHTVAASATDQAGNTEDASTGFTVTATIPSLCNLTNQFVHGSTNYLALTPQRRKIVDAVATAACQTLKGITPKLNTKQKSAIIATFKATVNLLVAQGWVTPSQATTLTNAANTL